MLPEPELLCAPPAPVITDAQGQEPHRQPRSDRTNDPERPEPTPWLVREHPRQPEPRHVAVVDEAGDGRNPVALQRQHDHPMRAEYWRLLFLQVAAEGWLAVGPGR